MVLAGLQGALGCDEKMERRGEEILGEEILGEDEPESGLPGSLEAVSGSLPGSLCIPSISLPGCLRGLSLVMGPAATWHWWTGGPGEQRLQTQNYYCWRIFSNAFIFSKKAKKCKFELLDPGRYRLKS